VIKKILQETLDGVHEILHIANLRVDMSNSYVRVRNVGGGGRRDRECVRIASDKAV
jgi:hypothetical protein